MDVRTEPATLKGGRVCQVGGNLSEQFLVLAGQADELGDFGRIFFHNQHMVESAVMEFECLAGANQVFQCVGDLFLAGF